MADFKVQNPESASMDTETALLPDYLTNPDAVSTDADVQWRFGKAPNYANTRRVWAEGKKANHAAGSLPELVENLVKNWEVEASFKTRLSDWRTIDHANYTFAMNGEAPQSGEHMLRVGTYNAIITPSEFYCPRHSDFASSHKTFKRMMPTFAWEVLEVYSGPPKVSFKWRHWGVMKNDYVGFNDKGEKVTAKAHGGPIEIFGVTVASVNDKLQLQEVDTYMDPLQMFRQIAPNGIVNKQPMNRKVDLPDAIDAAPEETRSIITAATAPAQSKGLTHVAVPEDDTLHEAIPAASLEQSSNDQSSSNSTHPSTEVDAPTVQPLSATPTETIPALSTCPFTHSETANTDSTVYSPKITTDDAGAAVSNSQACRESQPEPEITQAETSAPTAQHSAPVLTTKPPEAVRMLDSPDDHEGMELDSNEPLRIEQREILSGSNLPSPLDTDAGAGQEILMHTEPDSGTLAEPEVRDTSGSNSQQTASSPQPRLAPPTFAATESQPSNSTPAEDAPASPSHSGDKRPLDRTQDLVGEAAAPSEPLAGASQPEDHLTSPPLAEDQAVVLDGQAPAGSQADVHPHRKDVEESVRPSAGEAVAAPCDSDETRAAHEEMGWIREEEAEMMNLE